MKTFFAILGIGILGGFIAAYFYFQGFFISWTKLTDIPEKPQQILAVNKGLWIKTETGNIYYYPSSETFPLRPITCDQNCWQRYETAPTNDQYIYKERGCGRHSPSTWWLVDSVSVCESIGPAAVALVYGFDKNGVVYYWLHPIGDMDGFAYLTFPIQGGVYAGIVAVLWLIIFGVYKGTKKWKATIHHDSLPDN